MSKLTATAVTKAKARPKQYKLADSGGMYLLVMPSGSKYWRYDYSFNKKRNTLALGIFPDISLADARKAHQKAREVLASGQDPSDLKKTKKLERDIEQGNSFEAMMFAIMYGSLGIKINQKESQWKYNPNSHQVSLPG